MISRKHLSLLCLLVLLVVFLMGWTEYANWREIARLQHRFREIELDSAAAEFQVRLLTLQGTLLRSGFDRHGEGGETASGVEGEQLKQWLVSRQQALTNLGVDVAAEADLVTRISAQFNRYLDSAHRFSSSSVSSPEEPSAKLRQLQADLEPLLTLADQWKDLHQASLEAEIANAQRSLSLLHAFLLGSFCLLLVLAVVIIVLVNRGLIAPLRSQLIASHAIIARQEKLASLGVLAAGVAHEIRNPLTAIKARLFSQQKRLALGSPEHVDSLVIKEEIQRLERIVRDVLQFARPGEPMLALRPALAFLREMGELMSPTLEKLDIKLTVEPGEELYIQIDPEQMKQVIINLIRNAADSIGKAGRITLSARRTVLPLASHRTEAVALEVEDTGRGIPPEVQTRLFDPFFTTKASGTGLGLAIAERIAQKHGGGLQYRTRSGFGTTFSVVLPNASPAETGKNYGLVRSAATSSHL
jgi:signal transduction histidine kinase